MINDPIGLFYEKAYLQGVVESLQKGTHEILTLCRPKMDPHFVAYAELVKSTCEKALEVVKNGN